MSGIPFHEQYFVEKHRNWVYMWLMFVLAVITLIIHGLLFHWIPMWLRAKRTPETLSKIWYFKFVKYWDMWTNCFCLRVGSHKVYYQPSMVLLGAAFCGINIAFTFVQTKDIDYLTHYYVVGRRVGSVGLGNLPTIMLMICKSNWVGHISGLQHDRLAFVHKWVARVMWVMITVHFIMCAKYWLDAKFEIMIQIPPQIFGMIAYGCMCMLNFASIKFIRHLAFDFFLAQHRVFNFIMLLMTFFHNSVCKAIVLVAVHGLVLDRIFGRIVQYVHKFKSPTRGMSEFEILDDETMAVTIPLRNIESPQNKKWYHAFLPSIGEWKAGQHVYLNVGKVKLMQYHPFTICSLSESGNVRLLIRKQKGFTKKLMKKLEALQAEAKDNDDEESISAESDTTLKMKAMFAGPYGGHYQSLVTFDYTLFVATGSGGAFTFPVALDLLKQIESRELANDYAHRPENPLIHIVWVIRHEENMIWFKDIIEQIFEYVQRGKARFDLYITQDRIPYEGKSSDEISEITDKDSKAEKTLDYTVEVKGTARYSFGSFQSEINRAYSRPNISEIIDKQCMGLIQPGHNYKSMAVVACGAEKLTYEIKTECQRLRRVRHGPDVYCYTEAF